MNKTLFLTILLTGCLAWVGAEDSTTLQVAPSDQVKYPDASQILNKTEPAPTTAKPLPPTAPAALPTNKPLVATTPVPAKTAPPAVAPKASTSTLDPEHGWFLKWTLTGDENGALGWVQALGLPATLHPMSGGRWEVWAGPLSASVLGDALKDQGGLATLVKK